jgi:hypothetical protein
MLLVVLALAGCSIRMRMGRAPDVQVLDRQLRVGISTAADVRRLLGEPYARGRSFLALDPIQRPTDMWTYYFGEGDMEDLRQMFLFVYLDQDVFHGYMWFSSLPTIQPPPVPPVR